jgi:hypothetical protein
LVGTVISLTDIPLYFMYNGAPPQWDILTRVLVGIVRAILVVFLEDFGWLFAKQGRNWRGLRPSFWSRGLWG